MNHTRRLSYFISFLLLLLFSASSIFGQYSPKVEKKLALLTDSIGAETNPLEKVRMMNAKAVLISKPNVDSAVGILEEMLAFSLSSGDSNAIAWARFNMGVGTYEGQGKGPAYAETMFQQAA
ncbi:MAG: hypothetical protein AAF570_19075, partial [Bacteroidota bacterium]